MQTGNISPMKLGDTIKNGNENAQMGDGDVTKSRKLHETAMGIVHTWYENLQRKQSHDQISYQGFFISIYVYTYTNMNIHTYTHLYYKLFST